MKPLTDWWRRRVLARERARYGNPDWTALRDGLPLLAGLTDPEFARLADLALLFLRDKRLEPVEGLELTDARRLTIALQACLPILELGLDWYRGWYAVILYPDEFVPEREILGEDGVVWIEREAKSGEAWEQGPVILSWADVEAGLAPDAAGYNVIIHEMAHKLDMLDGPPNGAPPLRAGMSRPAWQAAFAAAYADLCRRVDDGEETPLDPYATEAPAEFLAVTSEAFFGSPALLEAEYPAVYAQLRSFYRQDPLARQNRSTLPVS